MKLFFNVETNSKGWIYKMSKTLNVYKIEEPYIGIDKFSADNLSSDFESIQFTLSYYANIRIVRELLDLFFNNNLGDSDSEVFLIEEITFIKAHQKYISEIRNTLKLKDYEIEHLDDFFRVTEDLIRTEKHLFFNIM